MEAKLFPSHASLPQAARAPMVASLNRSLATTIDLHLQVKQAHWNIKGPQFVARHQLFDKLATTLRDQADVLAERTATLGGRAEGTARLAASASALPEYDLKAVNGNDHVRTLVSQYGLFAQLLRQGIDVAESHKDPVTVDIYVQTLRQAELDMWFLESHINL
jgi:starvation-inducible DNA-binding protein